MCLSLGGGGWQPLVTESTRHSASVGSQSGIWEPRSFLECCWSLLHEESLETLVLWSTRELAGQSHSEQSNSGSKGQDDPPDNGAAHRLGGLSHIEAIRTVLLVRLSTHPVCDKVTLKPTTTVPSHSRAYCPPTCPAAPVSRAGLRVGLQGHQRDILWSPGC